MKGGGQFADESFYPYVFINGCLHCSLIINQQKEPHRWIKLLNVTVIFWTCFVVANTVLKNSNFNEGIRPRELLELNFIETGRMDGNDHFMELRPYVA